MIVDFIWGQDASIANSLQKKVLLSEWLRSVLRSTAHFIINDPPERIIELEK